MKIDLTGTTAIVTGSTKGIGFAVARGLAACGAGIVVNGRKQDEVDAAVEAVRQVPGAGELRGVAADVGTAEGCGALIDAVPQADILVNNAGMFGGVPFAEITDEKWQQIFDVNVMSGVRLSRHYLPGMIERNWGRIVFTSSESALNVPPDMIHYGVTKTAYLALARGLAKEAAGTGVTVNSVLPGPTLTEGFEAMVGDEARRQGKSIEAFGREMVKSDRPTSIIGRQASPEEVAHMFVYACSREASATTGAALRVEGGIVESLA